MRLRFSRALAAQIRDECAAAAPNEACGLLLGEPGAGHISAIRPAANVAAHPRHRFEIDPAVLLAAHKAARAGGPQLIGHYHSHPGGDPVPSGTDAAMAQGRGEIWLILGAEGAMRGWRADERGFEEIALDIGDAL